MFYFGWRLIKNDGGAHTYTPTLLLILPCPVCSSAIFLTTAFAVNLFPGNIFYAFALSWGIFFIITSATFLTVKLRNSPKNVTVFTGEIMLLISLYFLFNIAVAPNFKDMAKIFRIAKYRGMADLSTSGNTWMLVIPVAALIAGIIFKVMKNNTYFKKLNVQSRKIT